MAAQLPGQGPLAEPLAARDGIPVDRAGVAQHAWARASTVAGPDRRAWPAQICGGVTARLGASSRAGDGRRRGEHQGWDDAGFLGAGAGALAGHLEHQQADGQPGERGDGAGRGGQPVGEDDRVARLGLDVADVPRDAHGQAGQRGGPGPDPLPRGPPVEVGDVQGELADGQEHVDLGGPGLGLPAGQPVVDRPVVQPRVAVRQGVGARQDRDHPDRVQRRAARARVHADLLGRRVVGFVLRLRIRESASSAVSSASDRVCRYLSVVTMLAWPRRSLTTCRSAPPAKSQDA
jgi:hypothetical protein